MSSLSGRTYSFGTKHPQDFVDDLYREYFDLHPEGSIVDVAVAVSIDYDTAIETKSMTVVDTRIMRVTNPDFDDVEVLTSAQHRYLAVVSDGPMDLLKEMLRWAKATGDALVWIRKTPEGYATPTEQAEVWHEALQAIDFAAGDAEHKNYVMAAIVNRKVSRPLAQHWMPAPDTGDPEIDLAIIKRLVTRPAVKHGWGEDHPFVIASREHLAAFAKVIGHEDEHGTPEHEAAHLEIERTSRIMGRLLSEAVLADPTESADAKQAAKLTLAMIAMTDAIKSKGQLGFQAPDAPPARLSDIMGLPQFGVPASDNTEPKIGFRPPKPDLLN